MPTNECDRRHLRLDQSRTRTIMNAHFLGVVTHWRRTHYDPSRLSRASHADLDEANEGSWNSRQQTNQRTNDWDIR